MIDIYTFDPLARDKNLALFNFFDRVEVMLVLD